MSAGHISERQGMRVVWMKKGIFWKRFGSSNIKPHLNSLKQIYSAWPKKLPKEIQKGHSVR